MGIVNQVAFRKARLTFLEDGWDGHYFVVGFKKHSWVAQRLWVATPFPYLISKLLKKTLLDSSIFYFSMRKSLNILVLLLICT